MAEQTKAIAPYTKLTELVREEGTRNKFIEILGPQKGSAFITSLLTVVYNDDNLRDCEPNSVITTALKAAAYDLPIIPELGMAYPIPYKNRKSGKKECSFQIGYKGYKQLALRTGKYKHLNVSPYFEGETVTENRMTGELEIKGDSKNDEILGYIGYLELTSGYVGYVHMTTGEIADHKAKFSQNWNSPKSSWKTNPIAMEKKTVLLKLLRDHGVFTFDISRAQQDEGEEEPTITDPEEDIIDSEYIDPDRPSSAEDWAAFFTRFQNDFDMSELIAVQQDTGHAQKAYDVMLEQHYPKD